MASVSVQPAPLVIETPQTTPHVRFCVWSAAALAAVLVLVALFNAIIDPFGLYQFATIPGFNAYKSEALHRLALYKALAARRLRPRAIVLGPSSSDIGLRMTHPGWSPDAVPRYNLSLDGASIAKLHAYLLHAQAMQPLHQVVLAFDFDSFIRPTDRTSDEPWLARPGDYKTPLQFFTVDLPILLNRDSLQASLRTIALQSRAQQDVRSGLQQELAGIGALAGLGRSSRSNTSFRRSDELYSANGQELGDRSFRRPDHMFTTQGPRSWFLYREDTAIQKGLEARTAQSDSSAYDEFQAIVQFCRRDHIDLRVFLSPTHARQWEIEAALGNWPEVEHWKRRLVQILDADAAAHPAEKRFSLYDFADYSSVTTEPIPLPSSSAEMTYYWDAAHYKQDVGDWILDRLFQTHAAAQPMPADFGVELNSSNIDAMLARVRSGQQQYRASNPAEIAGFQQRVHAQERGPAAWK